MRLGKPKPRFSAPWNETNAHLLEYELRSLARSAPVQEVIPSPYGVKYVLEGVVETPSGTAPRIRTIWILETGEETRV
ncbi:MAG TPA: hypothetical protein VI542_35340 [Candidatus Tectomicrobia bacterium]